MALVAAGIMLPVSPASAVQAVPTPALALTVSGVPGAVPGQSSRVEVSLEWPDVDVPDDVTGFRVYRGDELLGETFRRVFVDPDAPAGRTVDYLVVALLEGGVELPGGVPISVDTPAPEPTTTTTTTSSTTTVAPVDPATTTTTTATTVAAAAPTTSTTSSARGTTTTSEAVVSATTGPGITSGPQAVLDADDGDPSDDGTETPDGGPDTELDDGTDPDGQFLREIGEGDDDEAAIEDSDEVLEPVVTTDADAADAADLGDSDLGDSDVGDSDLGDSDDDESDEDLAAGAAPRGKLPTFGSTGAIGVGNDSSVPWPWIIGLAAGQLLALGVVARLVLGGRRSAAEAA